MIPNRTDWRLQDDTRAVAPLLGAILLFGFLVIGLSVYQAQVVPQQNAETEFEHFEDNRNELIELRDDISRAGEFNRARFPTVQLGTSYRTRIIGINGPPPAGLLETSDPYPINITNEDGDLVGQPQTRFIEYRPSYNEIAIGPTRYEHSVLYLDERDNGGGLSIIREQEIVDGEEVTVTALQNSFQETGTRRVTLEVYPTNDFNQSDIPTEGELKVSIPTRLDDYWNETLADEGDTFQGVDTGVHGNDVHVLNLNVNANDLRVNTVGIKTEPNEDPVTNVDTSPDIKVEDFTVTGEDTWEVPDGVEEVDVLVVAGGGGGGMNEEFNSAGAGGGGAGEVVYFEDYDVSSTDEIDVRVGEGGDGATDGSNPGENGANSVFDEIVAVGGGGGAGDRPDTDAQKAFGKDGGSGGGSRTEQDEASGGASISEDVLPEAEYFGNPGGDGLGGDGNDQGGAGGGGAEEQGSTNDDGELFCDGRNGGDGGDGGAGIYFGDVFGDQFGDDGYFGGGGGGGAYENCDDNSGGAGGIGGGGDGTLGAGSNEAASPGDNNTGGGGGGGASDSDTIGGDGGSGVVIVRWSE